MNAFLYNLTKNMNDLSILRAISLNFDLQNILLILNLFRVKIVDICEP